MRAQRSVDTRELEAVNRSSPSLSLNADFITIC